MHINKTMMFALFFSEIEEKKLFFVFIIRSVADSKIWPRSSQGKTILILEMLRQNYLHFKWAKALIFSMNTQNISTLGSFESATDVLNTFAKITDLVLL